MKSSDSDTDNECFESAEESLDENEEVENVKKKSQKSSESSERDVAEPASNRAPDDSDSKEENHRGRNSLSFRKRPERVKRLNSKTLNRSASKSPTNELIFKPDKIVSDVFFQDITSNISKNINKSLSTLQQKSSNVKDLIFSSLPTSTGNDSEGFSYDDKSAITSTDECNTSFETNSQNVNQSPSEFSETVKDKNIKSNEETFVEAAVTKSDVSVDRLSETNKEQKPPDILPDNSENQGDQNLPQDAAAAAKGDSFDFSEEEKVDISKLEPEIENAPSERKESFKNSTENSETTINKEQTSCKEISNTDLDSITKIEKQENNSFKKSKNYVSKAEEHTLTSETIPEAKADGENLSCSEEAEITDEVLIKTNDFNLSERTNKIELEFGLDELKPVLSHSKEGKVESDCNLDELKTALKNIVKEEKINVPDSSSNNLEGESNPEEKLNEVDESSKDGWDDFDFSDNEIDNITIENKVEPKVKNESKVINAPSNTKVDTVKLESGSKNVKQPTNQVKETTQPEVEENWDWDAWDETSHEREDKIDAPEMTKPQTKNISDSSDVSKWSGWDTFGQKPQEKQANWGLGSWGVDMLLNKATAVTQGISNVLEAGLGAPDPETLARMEKIERDRRREEGVEENEMESEEFQGEISKKNSLTNVSLFPVAGLTSLVAGVTSKIVDHSKIQEIGSKVITGGLDTLETFGKKTMEVLQEGDPGFKNKRALLLGNNKPVLSQVLREAREKADRESKKVEEKELAKKCHFETLFDDFQGMIHLEALEMLSRQCEIKLDQIRSGMNSEEQEDLNGILEEVEQLCSLDECDMNFKSSMLDFRIALQMAVEPLKNEISLKKIIQIHEDVSKWLQMSDETEPSFTLINQKLVSTLAELTAATVQQFHKSGELLSIKECRKTVEEVDALSRLTNVLCMEIKSICEKFMTLSQKKTSKEIIGDSVESFTEKATVVMENSTSYIRQAFDLLIPVLQLGAAV